MHQRFLRRGALVGLLLLSTSTAHAQAQVELEETASPSSDAPSSSAPTVQLSEDAEEAVAPVAATPHEGHDADSPSPAAHQPGQAETVQPHHEAVDGVQEKRARTISTGIDPSLPAFDDTYGTTETAVSGDGDWRFQFHGFLRAPMRMGIGPKNDGSEGIEEHSPPRVPDLSFTDWRYTHNVPGPWTQLLLSYGNERVTATVGVAAFTHTNAGYRNLQANLGINEAFLTLRFPETFGRYGGLVWTVGSFSNRYGTAGKYNAGRYNTYLFGRTRVAGETLTAGLNLTPDIELTLEHGFGAKLEVVPALTVNPRPDYLPYPGPEAQGTTWVNHAHISLDFLDKFTIAGHYLHSRSPDDNQLPGAPSTPGHMTITGGELRFRGGPWGHGYVGFSHIDAEEILSLSDGIEVLHSFAGWNFKNNYFGRYDPRTGTSAPDTSGKVDSVLFQYDLSIGSLARLPIRFRGNGPDLRLSVFGMFNSINSENNSHQKFKWGTEAVYKPFSVLGIGLRYDLVQPNLSDNDESFAVISPKLYFQTQYITKEEITLQYSRYFLGDKAYPSYPNSDIDSADPNVIMVVGKMWW